jgi:hypothetical protein
MEFGFLQGLARPVDWDGRISDLHRQSEETEAARQRAANRAKMFADDTQYTNAINSYDHSLIKGYSQEKIKELGAWTRNNPDWQYNPVKYAEYRSRVNDLKDNDLLHKGLRVDSEMKKFDSYLNDPKNNPMRNSPEIQQYKQHLQNYLLSGSTDGVKGNNKEFKFVPPEQLTDITPTLLKYAKSVRQSGVDYRDRALGVKSRQMFVTSDDKLKAAKAAIDDYETGHIIQTNYNHYLGNLKANEKPKTIEQYTIEKMDPFFETDKYEDIHYQVKDGGSGSGSSKDKARDLFRELYDRGRQAPTVEIQAGANGTRERILGKNTALNTNGSYVKTSKGDWIPFNGGIIPADQITTSNSRFVYHPNKGGHLSYSVVMPLNAVEQALGGASVFDLPTFGTKWLGNSTNIEDKYKDYGIQLIKDEKGNELAQIDLWSPTEANNSNEHAAYNHGMGAKPEEIISSGTVGGNMVTGPDGTQWQKGSDGNIYGSNGMVYSSNGQRLK